jgi:hypothetical protein
MIHAYSSYSGLTLHGTYSLAGGETKVTIIPAAALLLLQ